MPEGKPLTERQLDNEISQLLKTVADHFDKEDSTVRESQIKKYRQLKLYWNNFSKVYWSEVAHDYRLFGRDSSGVSLDQEYYDKPINVFRAFLETIIAALSVQIPAVSCIPDDADNPLDLSTAKAGDIVAELLYKHNDVVFLWLHALYIYCTEGLIGCHSYIKNDKKYGTYQKQKYEDEEVESYVCPNCGERVPDEVMSNQLMNEFMPTDVDVELQSELMDGGAICPECAVELDPLLQKSKLTIPRLVGMTTEPKSSVCMEVYGGLYIKVANYAKKQEDTPYLTFTHETHYSNVLERYPKLRDHLPKGKGGASFGDKDLYEARGRLNTQYRGEEPEENVTCRDTWLRTSSFNILEDVNYRKLKAKFPNGVKVSQVNGIVCDYENQSLDDHWTLTRNPVSDFLNHDPLGELLINIQDIIDDLISLTLQTIEHGIEQTWADPAVVDFQSQRQIEAAPGTITPTKPVSGSRNIGEAFYSTKTASLSPEIFQFYRIIQELGQFVSGALPSLFGGQQAKGASKTASEYAMSRSGAQQRLQTPWKMLIIWWKEIFGKSIPAYMKNLKEDERLVHKDDRGNFINVFIRKSEIEGKIGSIELEPGDQLPISDEQQKDIIMQLMQVNNQAIMQAMMSAENLPYIKKAIKIPQFKLPGEDDRQKQHEEINQLINSEPIPQPIDPQQAEMAQAMGQPPPPEEVPSVEADPDVDNHDIEASICRTWLISDAGRLAKIENPNGYRNVLLHMKQHMDIIKDNMFSMQQQQSQIPPAGPANPANQAGKEPLSAPKQPEKITGANDARTPVGK